MPSITAENINELVTEAGFSGNIGVCSIDIDGNDCWVWKALHVVSPAVVVIETHIEFGMQNIAVPYDRDYHYPPVKHPDYHGASAGAMHSLATIRTVWEANHRIHPMFPEYSYARFTFDGLDRNMAYSLARASYVVVGTKEGKQQVVSRGGPPGAGDFNRG